jgi:hypothetical protein
MKTPAAGAIGRLTPQAAHQRRVVAERQAAGLCIQCGLGGAAYRCALCRAAHAAARQDNARIVRREFSPAVLKESLTTEPLSFA